MWAANAAKEIFEGIFGKLRPQGKDGEFYRLGFLVGLSRKLMPEIFNVEKKLAAFFANSDLMDLAMKMIRNESDISIADFHRGYADGILEGKQITPSTTLPVYAVFVIKWQEMAELKNVSQVVTLLETYLPSNLVGSRDRIAKLCQRIRFPLTDKGGRPKLKPRKA